MLPPTDLVMLANHRSVPIAVVGATPKIRIRSGAISDPPPTPVTPTRRPTRNPESAWAKSIAAG
jgi:hypothetical protein